MTLYLTHKSVPRLSLLVLVILPIIFLAMLNDPKPDTHTISFKLNYELTEAGNTKQYQEPVNVEVSIFPAFTSMLLGTLSGGF